MPAWIICILSRKEEHLSHLMYNSRLDPLELICRSFGNLRFGKEPCEDIIDPRSECLRERTVDAEDQLTTKVLMNVPPPLALYEVLESAARRGLWNLRWLL